MNILGSSQRTDQTDQAINALFDASDDNELRSQSSSQQAICGRKRTRPEGGSSNELCDSDSESGEPSTKYRKLDSSREAEIVRVSTRGSSSGAQNCIASEVRHEDERQYTRSSRGEGRELTSSSAEQPQEPSSVQRSAMQEAAPERKMSFKSIIEGLRQPSDERLTSQKRRQYEFTDDDIFNEDNDLNWMRVTDRDIHDPYREREDDEVDWEDETGWGQARRFPLRQEEQEGVTLAGLMEIDPFPPEPLPETPRLKISELPDPCLKVLAPPPSEDELYQSHSSSSRSNHSQSDSLNSSSHSNSDSHSSSRMSDQDSQDFMNFIQDSEESDVEESSVQDFDSSFPDEMLLDLSSSHSNSSDGHDYYDSDSSNPDREQLLSLEDVNKISLFTLTEADIEFIQTKAKKPAEASAEGAFSSMPGTARPEQRENEGPDEEDKQPALKQANNNQPLPEGKSLTSAPPYINPEDPIAGAYELIEELFNERSLDFERSLARHPECIICMKDYQVGDEIRVLKPCLHNYHAVCIDRWLTEERGTCPVDRLKVDLCSKVD